MTAKDRFLGNIQAKIKILQAAYDYNKNLPDDLFESMGEPVVLKEKTSAVNGHHTEEKEYGVHINNLRGILSASGEGLSKSEIMERFPKVAGDKYTIVTNALSSLNKGGEVEGIKPKGKKMRGFIWKLKA